MLASRSISFSFVNRPSCAPFNGIARTWVIPPPQGHFLSPSQTPSLLPPFPSSLLALRLPSFSSDFPPSRFPPCLCPFPPSSPPLASPRPLIAFPFLLCGKPDDLDPGTSRHHLHHLRTVYLRLRFLADAGCVFLGHGLANDFRMCNLTLPPSQAGFPAPPPHPQPRFLYCHFSPSPPPPSPPL